MTKPHFGIDPGKKGAVVLRDEGGVVLAWRTPLIKGQAGVDEYDLPAMHGICNQLKALGAKGCIESVSAFPTQGDAMSSSSSNHISSVGFGFWLACLKITGLTYTEVPSQSWRPAVGVQVKIVKVGKRATKEEKAVAKKERKLVSIQRAQELGFTPKGDGEADAFHIARYAQIHYATPHPVLPA